MKKKRQEQILLAARECFEKFGYNKTTLDDIGQKIGLNKASIYYYFKNKEAIYMAIVLRDFKALVSKLYEEIDKAIDEEMNCDQKILIYFEKRHQWWFKQAALIPQVTKADVQKFITIAKDIKNKIEEEEKENFERILKKCIKRGQIRENDVKKTTRLIFAIENGVRSSYRSVDNMTPVSIEESNNINADIQSALKIFIRGLQ
ncbi:MAG: TetR/AcrR family transcriptional regulator [Promethearchaeota archaeon]